MSSESIAEILAGAETLSDGQDLPDMPASADDAAPPPRIPVHEGSGGSDGPPDRAPEPAASFWRRVETCAALLPNDTDNGRRMLVWFGHDFLYVRDVGPHVWTGAHWQREGAEQVLAQMAQCTAKLIAFEARFILPTPHESEAIEAGQEAEAVPEEERTKAHKRLIEEAEKAQAAWIGRKGRRRAFSITSGNAARLTNMIVCASPHRTHGVDEMDRDPLALNCENGTLQFLREADPECPDPDVLRLVWRARLRAHRRSDLITKCAPVAYAEGATTKAFAGFLARFQPQDAVRRFLQVFQGYSILGVMGAQQLVFNYGEGANGKSTFIEILCRVMGPYARTLNAESITGSSQRNAGQASPDLAQLPGARMVRISELPRGEPLKETLVKQLTGGEPMMVRHNYGNFFEFKPQFKPVMSGNDKPRIDGVDLGIWRRIRLVLWGVTIPEAERRDMEEVLAEFWAEREGILAWLVEGALIYLSEGLRAPPEILEATAEYRAEMDPVQGFINACVTRIEGAEADEAQVQSRTLYGAYTRWCEANAIRPWSERAFSMTMVKKGFRKVEARIRYYVGIALHDVPAREPEGASYGAPQPPDEDIPYG